MGYVVFFIATSVFTLAQTQQPFDSQGHRGARGLAPENTLPAFYRALALGMRTLELDLAVTADSVLVVSHEPWFSREICRMGAEQRPPHPGTRNNIFRTPYLGVLACDCGSYAHPRFPEQVPHPSPKPALSTVFDSCEVYSQRLGREAPFYNIEIKSKPAWDGRFAPAPEVFVGYLQALLARYPTLRGRVSIQSFDARALQVLHRAAPDIPTVWLVADARPLRAHLRRLGFVPSVYAPNHRLLDSVRVAEAHRLGMRVTPWTVNETSRMRQLIEMGVDGLITDYPDRLQAVLVTLPKR